MYPPPRRSGGREGWMWDSHLSVIKPEFWDCQNASSLVFMEGTTPFHFDPRYYKKAHQVFMFFIFFRAAAKRRTC
jgi:hypothetical protein